MGHKKCPIIFKSMTICIPRALPPFSQGACFYLHLKDLTRIITIHNVLLALESSLFGQSVP